MVHPFHLGKGNSLWSSFYGVNLTSGDDVNLPGTNMMETWIFLSEKTYEEPKKESFHPNEA
ncbi:hypothetical protein [Chryseobacterium sp.]|uniref:hypothetical protein n=1 Tax=Chryseobacterium sp. TaxID=1871047 RepID=UPI002354489C|nr:hypothetical protein [Chryseobacterium sp.]